MKKNKPKKFLHNLDLPDIPDQLLIENKEQDAFNEYYLSETNDELNKKEEKNAIINIKCFWVNGLNAYSLKKLQEKEKDYHKTFENGEIIFNFCQNNVDFPKNTIIWKKKNETSLIKIAGTIDGDSDNKNEWKELSKEEEGGKTGLQITLVHGEKCQDSYHYTIFKIYCDEEVIENDKFLETVNLTEFYHKGDSCIHYIKASSICGCALNGFYLLRKFMNEIKIIMFIFLFVIGIYICMFGTKCVGITFLIIYFILFFFLFNIICINIPIFTTEISIFFFKYIWSFDILFIMLLFQ